VIELTGAVILLFLPGAGPEIRKRAGQEGKFFWLWVSENR